MAQRKQLSWTELRVGVFVLIGLAIMALAIFYVTGGGTFSPKYRLTTYLPEVEGLQVGALDHLIFVLALGGLATFFLGGIKRVEIRALVVVETFGMLMDDVCRHFVEECPIVRYHEYGAGIGLEVGG